MTENIRTDFVEAIVESIARTGALSEENCKYPKDTMLGKIERGTTGISYSMIASFFDPVLCGQAIIYFTFSKSSVDKDGKYKPGKIIIQILPRDKSGEKLRLTIQLSEGAAFFADGYPTTETYEAFCRKVRDRKAYPPAKVPIPGGGGKSFTAEGQTKKPGSHSHDRHK